MTAPEIVDVETIMKEVDEDEELQKIIVVLKLDSEGNPRYEWKNDQLRYKGRLVLPRSSSLIPSLLHIFHDSILRGHSGFGWG